MLASKLSKSRYLSKVYLYVENVRVPNWRGYLGIGMLGYIHTNTLWFYRVEDVMFEALTYLVSLAFFLSFAFSINNCFDAYSDSNDPKKRIRNPVARGVLSFREAYKISIILAFIGLILNMLFFPDFVVPLIYSSLIILAYFYSAPPLRLKSRPPFDLISHGLFFGSLLYLYGLAVNGKVYSYKSEYIALAISIFVYSIILELRNHIEDYEVDRKTHVRTSAICLGLDRALKLLEFLIGVHFTLLALLTYTIFQYEIMYLPYLSLFILLFLIIYGTGIDNNKCLRIMDITTSIVYLLCLLM